MHVYHEKFIDNNSEACGKIKVLKVLKAGLYWDVFFKLRLLDFFLVGNGKTLLERIFSKQCKGH